MFILQAIKPLQSSLSKWSTLLSEDLIQKKTDSFIFCSPFLCGIVSFFLKALHNWTALLHRYINSSGLSCFSRADTGEGKTMERKESRVARCTTVKIHLTSYTWTTFDLSAFHTEELEGIRDRFVSGQKQPNIQDGK